MSSQQRQEVLVAADVASKRLPNMSLEQIRAMCSRLPVDDKGTVSFHELQKYAAVRGCVCVCVHGQS